MTDLENKYPGDWSKPSPVKVLHDGVCDKYEVIATFGGWNVTVEGDMIHTVIPDNSDWYPIWSTQLLDDDNDDWVLHLSEKGWFDRKCYEDFKRAYFVACKIAGVEPQEQIRSYSEKKKEYLHTSAYIQNAAFELAEELTTTALKWLKKNPYKEEISILFNACQIFSNGMIIANTNKERSLILLDYFHKKNREIIADLPNEAFTVKD